MNEYTPSTEEVRIAYNHWGKYPEFAPDDFDVTEAEFDRWLLAERARTLSQWADETEEFYPREVFPEPTAEQYDVLRESLGSVGLTLDRFSADLMRRAAGLARVAAQRQGGDA